ncbi:MAG: carbon starvation CstA family protein [Acidiferrobacterales bacterium]
MTNSVFLLITALFVFAFGYRFFAKFLAVWVFRLDAKDYSTPAPASTDSSAEAVRNRHMLLGQHVGSLAAAATIIGTTLALFWGWIPAFLWVVVGSVIGGGTYGIGSLWLSRHQDGQTPVSPARALAGQAAGIAMTVLIATLSVLVNAVMALAAAELLVTYPVSAIPVLLQGAIALAFGVLLQRRTNYPVLLLALISLAATFLAIWLFRGMPLNLVGILQIQTTADRALSLDARVAWIAAIFAFAWYAAYQPPWKLVRPYGFLSAALLGATLLILFLAVVIEHPVLVAPAFHTPRNAPGLLPWLFVTLTSGAIGGWHVVVASGASARRLPCENDARYIGYGGALADAMIALSAIVIGATAFANRHAWLDVYGNSSGVRDLGPLLRIYVDGFAGFAHYIGINAAVARSLAALTVTCLSLTTIMTGIHAQRDTFKELAQTCDMPWLGKQRVSGIAVAFTAALAAQASRAGDSLWYWPLFGLTNQLVVIAVLALILLALARKRRPVALVLIPLLFVIAASVWILALQLIDWWSGDHWALFGTGLLLAFAAAWSLWKTAIILRKSLFRSSM